MKEKMLALLPLSLVQRVKSLPIRALLISLFAPVFAFSQSLDDFRNAAQSKYVQSIPFSSLRGDAASIARDIDSWEDKIKSSYKEWKTYEGRKNENYKAIRLANEDIKKQKDYISQLKSRGTDASQFEKLLDVDLKKVEGFEKDIERTNYEISQAADAWDRVGRLRGGLREKFDDVLYKLSSAKSSPNSYLSSSATQDDKNRLLGYINDIEAGIKAEMRGHRIAEDQAFNAKKNLESVLRKNSE